MYVRSGAKAALRLWLCAPVLPVAGAEDLQYVEKTF